MYIYNNVPDCVSVHEIKYCVSTIAAEVIKHVQIIQINTCNTVSIGRIINLNYIIQVHLKTTITNSTLFCNYVG